MKEAVFAVLVAVLFLAFDPISVKAQMWHNLGIPEDVQAHPELLNLVWKGKENDMINIAKNIAYDYNSKHVYYLNEVDCDDMSKDIWDMLFAKGINAEIVIGNLDLKDEDITYANHCWLLLNNYKGNAICCIESTAGRVYTYQDISEQYLEGFFYAKPSDLEADITTAHMYYPQSNLAKMYG